MKKYISNMLITSVTLEQMTNCYLMLYLELGIFILCN